MSWTSEFLKPDMYKKLPRALIYCAQTVINTRPSLQGRVYGKQFERCCATDVFVLNICLKKSDVSTANSKRVGVAASDGILEDTVLPLPPPQFLHGRGTESAVLAVISQFYWPNLPF